MRGSQAMQKPERTFTLRAFRSVRLSGAQDNARIEAFYG
jgi:hypothetical protein